MFPSFPVLLHGTAVHDGRRRRVPRVRQLCLGAVAAAALLVGGCAPTVDLEANKKLLDDIGSTDFTIYPAHVRRGAESRYLDFAATDIANFIEDKGYGDAVVSTQRIDFSPDWANYLGVTDLPVMYWQSFEDVADHLDGHAIDTDYAIAAEFLFFEDTSEVRGVHGFIVDKDGKLAGSVYLGQGVPLYHRISPTTERECVQLEILGLDSVMGPAAH